MAEEEISRDGSEEHSDRETYRDKVVQAANSSLEKLQFLAEDSLEYFHEQKNSINSSPQRIPNCEPGLLPKTKTSLDDIKHRLLSLIAQEEEEEETGIVYRRPGILLDEVQKVSFVSHTMAAFVATLDENLVRRIAAQIYSETTLWISLMFRFNDSFAYYHRDTKGGLVRIVRLVLHSRYPKYSANGYEALYTRPPIIYYCDDCQPGLQQLLCFELGLPSSCVVCIPVSPGAQSCSIDITILEKMILEHSSAAKTPMLVVGCAGASATGNMDDLNSLQELCQTHNIWLHIDGHALAALSLVSTPNNPTIVGQSMTLSLGHWIGVPTLPSISLYRRQETSHVHDCSLNLVSASHFDALPIWVTIQSLGCDNIIRRIQHCFKLTEYFISKLAVHCELRIHTKEQLKAAKATETIDDSVKDIGPVALFQSLITSIVFQYVPQPSATSDKDVAVQTNQKNPAYFDNLNSWLVQLLARNIPSVKTDILNLENFGICLRICFLESAHVMHTERNDIDCYYNCLQHQLGILNATVKQRELLYKSHKDHRKLKLVQITEWAGMGGARYIPEVWADRLNELTDTGKEDINHLNSELVAKLKISDSAFSVGEADDGMLCVRFGMVDEELNMDELINLVIAAGQEIEDSSRFLETMAEMVKHGIEEANKELVLENQEKLMQEGLLKQVPMIGSLVNWWFPAQSESGVKGRSFNLSSGTIESTENIYKYHMQIKEGGPQTPPPASKVLITPSATTSSPTPPISPPLEQTTAHSPS